VYIAILSIGYLETFLGIQICLLLDEINENGFLKKVQDFKWYPLRIENQTGRVREVLSFHLPHYDKSLFKWPRLIIPRKFHNGSIFVELVNVYNSYSNRMFYLTKEGVAVLCLSL
jgi:hypothetical protein